MRFAVLLVLVLLTPLSAADQTLPRDLEFEQRAITSAREAQGWKQRAVDAELARAQIAQTLVAQETKAVEAELTKQQAALDQKKVAALGGVWDKGDRLTSDGKTLKRAGPAQE